MPRRVLYFGFVLSALLSKNSGKTILSEKAQPNGKVSPTTHHCGSPQRQRILPRSWIKPVKTNQRGCPSARICSEVWSKCSSCERSVSGSESSTSVLRYSIASHTFI